MVHATSGLLANFFKRIGSMPSKYGNLQYYKGRGANKEGVVNSTGKFVADVNRMKFIVAPVITDTNVYFKPYVSKELKLASKSARTLA